MHLLGWKIEMYWLLTKQATSAAARAKGCPHCGYATKGLSGGVCPECGEELSEPRARTSSHVGNK